MIKGLRYVLPKSILLCRFVPPGTAREINVDMIEKLLREKVRFFVILPFIYHISLFSLGASFVDMQKQCRPSTDATKCGIWSGSTLFAYRSF